MQKWNIQTDRAQKVDEKRGYLSYVCSWSYGHWNVKNGSFIVGSVDASKKSVTVWRKYIVYIGVSCPLKTPPLLFLFLAKPPLNQQTVQAPFLGNPTSTLVFHEAPHKSQIFQRTPKIIKFFILNTILSFNSN